MADPKTIAVVGLSVIPSAEVAEAFWDMATTRDRIEHVAGDVEALHRAMAAMG